MNPKASRLVEALTGLGLNDRLAYLWYGQCPPADEPHPGATALLHGGTADTQTTEIRLCWKAPYDSGWPAFILRR